ncbi:putative RND superfamily exporter protein [Clostridiales Family XIII bacterium PM5-7]
MGLIKDNNTSWSDIKTLYTNLNTARTKFGFETATVPEKEAEITTPTDITDIKSLIEAMTTNSYVGSTASTESVIVPASGDIMQPTPFTEMETIIQNVNDTCAHNASYFAGNYAYNSSFNSSNYGYNSTFNSSNYGFNSSFNSNWNSGNYSFNSSFNSNWNSGNYSFRR